MDPLDLAQVYQAIEPSRTLYYGVEADRRCYIDFASVRGGEAIKKLRDRIVVLQPNQPTCSLIAGHIGCGKSTELLKLQTQLEALEFQVVYFESSKDLELADVDIIDVLLVIARHIIQELEPTVGRFSGFTEARGFRGLLQRAAKAMQTEIELSEIELNVGIGNLTMQAKNDRGLREKLNQALGTQKTEVLRLLNQEILEPVIRQLQQKHRKKGLVVIVDNLDRIDNREKFGKNQQEYLFVDQGDILSRLACHTVYTMPLALRFSNEYSNLRQRFTNEPQVLPMVRLHSREGEPCPEGLALLKQMVLARIFPELSEKERLGRMLEVFAMEQVFDRLCQMSGGHVRDLLVLCTSWVEEEMALPLTGESLEAVLDQASSAMKLPISEQEWGLLKQVKLTQSVSDEVGYDKLIRSRMVFEYQEGRQSWFAVNPLLTHDPHLL